MNSNRPCRFVLLDFGYPMSANTAENIVNSLENILLLSLAFSQNANETNFMVSALSPDFAIIHFESDIWRNYSFVKKNLKTFLKSTSGRVSVQDFKNLLSSSVDAILCEAQKKFKARTILNEQLIQIAVVSKKTACILADILAASVTSKLQVLSTKNFKIVQILSEPQMKKEKNSLIDWIFCLDDPNDLNNFFKNWFLNSQLQLQILLSKDANLDMKCEVEDCTVNPVAFGLNFDLFSDIWAKRRNSLIDKSTQVCKLEVIHRLPVNSLSPTLMYGTTRRIKATSWPKSQTNSRLFKELCRELNRTGEGLLAKLELSTDLVTFHFLTSDGDMILMNNVAPSELHLPKREEFPNCVEFSDQDENCASVVRNCLQKIKFLNYFNPENLSSRINEFLKNYFDQMEQRKNFSPPIDKSVKKKENPVNSKNNTENKQVSNKRKKKQKSESEKTLENVHPALLSPTVVEKYRKIDRNAFNLPELGKKFF